MSDKEKSGVMARLGRALDIPPDVLSRESMIEIRGRELITVHGCERIIRYLPDEIRIATAKGGVSILGARLVCISYSGKSVGIEGRIDKVLFLEAREV